MGCEWVARSLYELSVSRSNISPSASICPRGNQHWTGISGSRFRPVSYFGVTGLKPLVWWVGGWIGHRFFLGRFGDVSDSPLNCARVNFSRRVLPQHRKASLPNDQTRCVGVFCFCFGLSWHRSAGRRVWSIAGSQASSAEVIVCDGWLHSASSARFGPESDRSRVEIGLELDWMGWTGDL